MFRRKQDVDRHVSSILGRIKEDRERQAKGYQIARLYFEVGEFDIARRYLSSFLSVRDSVPQAYRLLGEIEEAKGNKENAVDAYKRFVELGGSGKETVLKICQLYGDIGADAGVGKYWLEKAEQLYPQSDEVFKLKEKLIKSQPGENSNEYLENLLSSELVKKPQDIDLRIKLLRLYLVTKPVDEAYNNAIETDRTTAFTSSLDWYECLHEVFKAYKRERDPKEDGTFMFHYLVCLCNLTYLRLANKDVVESAEALHSFDLAVQAAINNIPNSSEQWEAFLTEMQGQLFFMAGTLLLKRAQKGSVTWNEMRPVAAVFFMLCQTVPTVDAQATWFVRPSQDREKLYAWLYKNSFFRVSQSGHSLYNLAQGDVASWAQRMQQQCCTTVGQEKAYEALFPIRDMRAKCRESYLVNTHKFCNTALSILPRRQLYDVDRVAHLFHPDQLSELVWLCLQQYSFGDPHQPDYNMKLFETLQYSVRNMENGAAETLCQLDTEAFLYATVRCSALTLKEQQMSVEDDMSRPAMLPLCLCKRLCTLEQEQWWSAACSFYTNTIKGNFAKMRHVLQRGIEVVRLVGNHGLCSAMVVHLAKTFDAKRRPCRARLSPEDLVKSLIEGERGNRGSANQIACLESRAALYWNHALTVLSRLERNHRGPAVKFRLFDDGSDADLAPEAVNELLQDAKFASATIAMKEGRYEDAIKGFEKLTTPYASFYRAQIFKSMAQQELEGSGPEEVKQQRYTALVSQARDALYRTMDHLGGNKNHELNILLTRELDDVESKLSCYDWDNENSNRLDGDDPTGLHTPVKNGHHGDNLGQPHSTPKSQGHGKSVRQRLLMSELASENSPIPQRAPASSPSTHTRPSPERMDAQIKSLNYSQTGLFKVVMDRNEELAVMYRGLVEELRENNAQLKGALGDNQKLMTELKLQLNANREALVSVQTQLTEVKDTVRQLKDEFQAGVAAAVAPNPAFSPAAQIQANYLMGSPYQPAYPPYAQVPGAPAGYRYPLIPTPRQPAAVSAASARLSGTAPSSFGKFRDHGSADVLSTAEDEEDDDENGLCEGDYGEGMYYLNQHEWPPAHGGVAYPSANQPQAAPTTVPAIPQPGYFASALRGQALQYAPGSTHTLPMPGPGFFSAPVATTLANPAIVNQSAIVNALGVKIGAVGVPPGVVVVQQPQPIPVIGGAAKPAVTPVTLPPQAGEVILFTEGARLTTTGGEFPAVEVSVLQDRASKQGYIVVSKRENGAQLLRHNMAAMKMVQSFNPNFFLWNVHSSDKKLDETYRLSFDSPEQVKRLRTAFELVIKSAGIKPQMPSPVFAAKSPAMPSPGIQTAVSTPAAVKSPQAPPSSTVVSTPTPTPSPSVFGGKASPATTSVANIFGGNKPSFTSAPSPTTLTSTASGSAAKATLGGFTFSAAPVVKPAEDAAGSKDAPKLTPQFKLKESTIKVTGPTTPTSTTTTPATTTATSSPGAKPFAGFTFTASKPAVSPGTSGSRPFGFDSAIAGPSYASVAAHGAMADAHKAGALPTQSSSVKSPGGKDDDKPEEYEPAVDFKPIIDLPDLIEVKTGEEGESKVFSDRVKLFRFDSGQWKERGIGELKILKSDNAARFRVLMRREQVFKVCANHYIAADMKLTPLATSDRAWCYTASDYAEQEVKVEKFAIRFKTADKASEFKATFEACQAEIVAAEKAGASKSAASSPVKTKDKVDGGAKPSLSDMFRPAEGSWECPGCCVQNNPSVLHCVACQTLKPGAKAENAKSPAKEDPFAAAPAGAGFGGFKFGGAPSGGGGGGGSGGGFKFGTVSTPQASAPQQPAAATALPPPAAAAASSSAAAAAGGAKSTGKQSLAEQFRPKEGSWECPGCCIVNNADILTCPACQTTKPGSKPQDAKSPPKEDPFAPSTSTGFGGFTFGSAAEKKQDAAPGFKFGSAPPKTEAPKATPTATATTTAASDATIPAGFKFTFGTPTTKPPAPGFSFGSGSGPGFSFSSASKESASTPSAGERKESAGFAFAKPQAQSTPSVPPPKSECGSALLQQLLTTDDTPASKPASDANKPISDSTKAALQTKLGATSSGDSGGGFQFTFNKEKKPVLDPTSPKSPEIDERGFYMNKEGEDSHIYFEPVVPLPEKVEVKTGEEEEAVLFESRAKLYRFISNEWKERGLGVIKVLEHKATGKIRILMRREQVLKICCNHFVTSDLDLKPMARSEGKAWVWYAMDFTEGEGKMEQLAVRFRDPDIANNFKRVFDEAKVKMSTPSKKDSGLSDPNAVAVETKSPSAAAAAGVARKLFHPQAEEDYEDVEFLYEEQPTADQVDRARKLLLPDTFYLYENRPGCPGCIGCEDFDPSKAQRVTPNKGEQKDGASAAAARDTSSQKQPADKDSEGLMFGTTDSGVSFSALAAASGDSPGFGVKDSSKPFHWAGAGQRLFGQGGGGSEEQGEDGEVPPCDDIHFEPVIPLPDLIEVKTGEEEWTTLFSQRGKVYRFDGAQWKERGIGEMKISQHNTKLKFRVLLRREQVLKVACNHLISAGMELKPMSTSETAWCWVAEDFTEGQPKVEQFAVKFKKVETAKEFKSVFESCQERLRLAESGEPVQESMVSSSGNLGNVLHNLAMTVCAEDTMTLTNQPITGDRGNVLYSQALNVGAKDTMTLTNQPITGDRGNVLHTQALNVGAKDTMTLTNQPVTGDRGNVLYSKQLDVGAAEAVSPSVQPVMGDKGNPYYTQQLNAAAQDSMVSSSEPITGDRGNPYHTQALDVAAQDAQITSTSFQPLSGGDQPNFSQILGPDEGGAEEQYEEYDDDDEDDDDSEGTEEEEEERVEFEKRITLMAKEGEQWKKVGMGDLRVLYDDDLNANKIDVITEAGERLCSHVIYRELSINLDEKKKSCEWHPIDYATDEPVKRQFKACFSSTQAAEEFSTIFRQGLRLAAESDISAPRCDEIDVPEVFSTGDRSDEAGAASPK